MVLHYEKNLAKFAMYANRNIFTTSSLSSTEKPTVPTSITNEISALDIDLFSLRSKFVELRESHALRKSECRDSDLLLKDMRNALFNLRIGAQALDEVQPLADTLAIVEQHKRTLYELSRRAGGK
jgi:hypothetical protein